MKKTTKVIGSCVFCATIIYVLLHHQYISSDVDTRKPQVTVSSRRQTYGAQTNKSRNITAIPKNNDVDIRKSQVTVSSRRQIHGAQTNNSRNINAIPKNKTTNDISKRQRRLPQAIIIGAKKGGTFALRAMLKNHPHIRFSKNSEVDFFHKYYGKGLKWYRQQMELTFPNQITMEKSPDYFIKDHVPQRIQQMNSSIRLIITIRDPITRLISDYWHEVMRKRISISLEDVITKPENEEKLQEFVTTSLYHYHYIRWLKYFNPAQIHIVDGENLIINPLEELKKLESFLGVKPYFLPRHFIFNEKKGYYCYHKNCLPASKGHKHEDVTEKNRSILKALLSEDVHLFAKDVKREYKWMENY